jgi:hypothetical protein
VDRDPEHQWLGVVLSSHPLLVALDHPGARVFRGRGSGELERSFGGRPGITGSPVSPAGDGLPTHFLCHARVGRPETGAASIGFWSHAAAHAG